MEIAKLDKEYINLVLSSLKSENPLTRMSELNRKSLKELVKYLSKLNKEQLIDDKQLSELISMACANYIENEVEIRIERTLNDKLMYFFDKI